MKWFKLLSTSLVFSILSLSLCAQGIPTGTAHHVVLTWLAPSPVLGSGVVAGYNIYRTVSTSFSYAKLNPALIPSLTFMDTAVVSGTTYVYCATTVDSNGSESACTATVSATIPSNPNPPTGLVVIAK